MFSNFITNRSSNINKPMTTASQPWKVLDGLVIAKAGIVRSSCVNNKADNPVFKLYPMSLVISMAMVL